MTLATTANTKIYVGNNSTTTFSFPYLFYADADLVVTVDATAYTLNGGGATGYTVTGAENPAGGSVVFNTAPITDADVIIQRVVSYVQETDFENFDGNPADVTEKQFDLLAMQTQQLSENVSRAVTVPVGETAPDVITLLADATEATDIAQAAAEAAQAAAELAQTGAETAESNAETAENNAEDAIGANTSPYIFSSNTSMADPTSANVRFNNATVSSVTAIAIDDLTNSAGNPDISAWIATWADSTNTEKGRFEVRKKGTPATFAIFDITGLTDNAGWSEIAVTYITGNGSFTDTDDIYVTFVRTGDKGVDGTNGTDGTDGTDGSDGVTTIPALTNLESGNSAPAIVSIGATNPGGNINFIDATTTATNYTATNLTDNTGAATTWDIDITSTDSMFDNAVTPPVSADTTDTLNHEDVLREFVGTSASSSSITITYSGLTPSTNHTVGFVLYRPTAARNVFLTGNGVTNYDYNPNQSPPEFYEFTDFASDGSGNLSFTISINNAVQFAGISGTSIFEQGAGATPVTSDFRVVVQDKNDSNSAKYLEGTTLNTILSIDTAQIVDSAVTFAKLADVLDEDNMASNSATKLATQRSIKAYIDTIVNAIGSIGGGTQDIDLSLGLSVSGTIDTGTTTFTFSNPNALGRATIFTLRLTNGGSQTINWPASVDWVGGTAPTLTTSGVDELTFKTIDGGTTWVGLVALDVK